MAELDMSFSSQEFRYHKLVLEEVSEGQVLVDQEEEVEVAVGMTGIVAEEPL